MAHDNISAAKRVRQAITDRTVLALVAVALVLAQPALVSGLAAPQASAPAVLAQ